MDGDVYGIKRCLRIYEEILVGKDLSLGRSPDKSDRADAVVSAIGGLDIEEDEVAGHLTCSFRCFPDNPIIGEIALYCNWREELPVSLEQVRRQGVPHDVPARSRSRL